jgi:hypothetical protein
MLGYTWLDSSTCLQLTDEASTGLATGVKTAELEVNQLDLASFKLHPLL